MNWKITIIAALAVACGFAIGHVAPTQASTAPATAILSTTLGQTDITDAEAIRFCNEVVRPTAEKMRALDAEIDAALVTWYAGMNTKIANDSSAIDDGREAEGVSRLTGADVNNLITQMAAYQTQLNQAGVANVISKPCVRTLEVQ